MKRFDKNIWSQLKLSRRTGSAWLCAACRIGQLELGQGHITSDQEAATRVLKCTNPKCRKEYTAIGKLTFEDKLTRGEWEVSKEYIGPKYSVIHPMFFYPTLDLFDLPSKTSMEVKHEIGKAFQQFWSDNYSTLNAIRRSLEYLMDDFGIVVLDSLHQRIEAFEKVQPQHKDAIMALKHLGNAGSHKKVVSREDVIDAFEILCVTLHRLYPDDYDYELDKKVQEINSKKGPRSKTI